MALKERIARFIRKEVEVVPFATTFVLRVVDVDGRDTKIKSFGVNAKQDPKTQGEALAGEVFEMAADVAKSMVGMARFRLYAKVGKGEFRSQFPFVVRGGAQVAMSDGAPGGMVTESEPATPTGIVGQAMRHNEAIMRMMIESLGSMTEGLRQENEALRARVVRSEEVWQQGREKLEELMDRSLERQIKQTQELASEERKDRMLSVLTDQVGPQVARQIPSVMAKMGLLPEAAAAASRAGGAPSLGEGEKGELREILSSLDEKAANTLQESLGPEKLLRLMALLQ